MRRARGAAIVAAATLALLAAGDVSAQQPPDADSARRAPAADAAPDSGAGQTAGAATAPRAGERTTAARVEALSAAAGVAPDTVTVGDHFRVLVRVRAPAGATVVFPPFNLVEPVQAVDSVRVRSDSLGTWTASYSLTAWITSDSLVAAIPFRVRTADGSTRDLRVRVELPHVRSVLPADSALHVPKPAKAVIPIVVASPTPRGWLLPAALLGVVLAGILWLVLRRRSLGATAPVDARAAALARLREIEGAGLLARGEVHEYHVRTSRVLREYLAIAAQLGEDLTSSELLQGMRLRGIDARTVAGLEGLLREADRVKFAGAAAPGGAIENRTHGERAAEWIASWPPSDAAGEGQTLTEVAA